MPSRPDALTDELKVDRSRTAVMRASHVRQSGEVPAACEVNASGGRSSGTANGSARTSGLPDTDASSSALVSARDWADRCVDTTRWSRARVQATYSSRRRSWSVHLLVDRLRGLEVAGLDAASELDRVAAGWGHSTWTPLVPRAWDVMPDSDDHRELQALGGVDGHDAHGVGVGLGQHRLGDPRRLSPWWPAQAR